MSTGTQTKTIFHNLKKKLHHVLHNLYLLLFIAVVALGLCCIRLSAVAVQELLIVVLRIL